MDFIDEDRQGAAESGKETSKLTTTPGTGDRKDTWVRPDGDMNDVDRPLELRAKAAETFEAVMDKRFNRRDFMRTAAAAAPVVMAPNLIMTGEAEARGPERLRLLRDTLFFDPIEPTSEDAVVVPNGYVSDTIIRWGDSINLDVDDLDTSALADGALFQPGAAEAQANQFGYNCDAAHFFPIDASNTRGLICVNHEFTTDDLMFPGFENTNTFYARLNEAQQKEAVATGQAAHGITVVEIERPGAGGWTYRVDSRFNRRITANTEIEITGPAAGDPLMQAELPDNVGQDGTRVLGTLNNCAGGLTPWRTYLSAEENYDQYFANFNDDVLDGIEARNPKLRRALERSMSFISSGPSFRRWEEFGTATDARFDLAREPKEAMRFGWIVEVDPFDPESLPKKRTAMGRFKHECAASAITRDNRVAVYSGDDARLEYVYKFVSADQISGDAQFDREADLLDRGTLYVARFDANGTGEWLPLIYGQNGLDSSNGFDSQAEVLINTRGAADVLGATPMDRPEDIDPIDGRVYVAMTKNGRRPGSDDARDQDNTDASNPRLVNTFGHIVEMREARRDHGATRFNWEIFILCGDPAEGRFISSEGEMKRDGRFIDLGLIDGLQDETTYNAGFRDRDELSPIGAPDNLTHDDRENLWIITDGSQPRGNNDGTFAVPTAGRSRGKLRQFMSGPVGAEVCGAEFTQDYKTLFLNIQHPGDGGPLAAPTSTWPDGDLANPPVDRNGNIQPRPSLIAVRRLDDRQVGD